MQAIRECLLYLSRLSLIGLWFTVVLTRLTGYLIKKLLNIILYYKRRCTVVVDNDADCMIFISFILMRCYILLVKIPEYAIL